LLDCAARVIDFVPLNMLNTRLSTLPLSAGSARDSRPVGTHKRALPVHAASPDAVINRALLAESVMSAAGLLDRGERE
jgi:hypothetical protein